VIWAGLYLFVSLSDIYESLSGHKYLQMQLPVAEACDFPIVLPHASFVHQTCVSGF
ncbi:hypothetical protein TorRG33x02_101060, partial [Trema orientale]